MLSDHLNGPGETLPLKFVFIVIFGSCFVAQVWNEVDRFIKKDTTVTSSTQKPDYLDMPVVTLCQQNGFKFDTMSSLGLSKDQWVWGKITDETFRAGRGRDELNRWWNMTTSNASDFILRASFDDSNASNEQGLAVAIETTPSLYAGRCFTVVVQSPARHRTQFLKLDLNVSLPVNLFVHQAVSERANFMVNHWILQPYEVSLSADCIVNLEVSQVVQVYSEQFRRCDLSTDAEQLHTCVWTKASHCINCYHPYFSTLESLTPANLPLCSNVSQVSEVFLCVYDAIARVRAESCLDPCHKTEYEIAKRPFFLGGKATGMAFIYLYFKDIELEVRREYVLFDFNAILSAVGGSMGLFLGFSFLDCSVAVCWSAKRWWMQRSKTRRSRCSRRGRLPITKSST
jgi:hypothetical protein